MDFPAALSMLQSLRNKQLCHDVIMTKKDLSSFFKVLQKDIRNCTLNETMLIKNPRPASWLETSNYAIPNFAIWEEIIYKNFKTFMLN